MLMEFFFNRELSEEVLITLSTADVKQMGFHTNTDSLDAIIDSAKARVLNGTLVIAYHKYCVFFLTDYFPGVVLLDSIRGNHASLFDYIDGVKKLLAFIKDETKIHKVVTKTPFKELNKLQKRIGFEIEGTHKEEYLMPDGTYADTYSFGYILRR